MNKFAGLFLVVIMFVSLVSAQSGRKPQQTPTPKPTPDEFFSESTPAVKNPIYIPKKRRKARQERARNLRIKSESGETEDDLIKIESTLITFPVSVSDKNGIYVPDLQKENFKVFENEQEQEIEIFGTSDQPFSVILLLDTSFSADNKIGAIQAAARAFVRQLKPEDKVMVIEFDGNNHVLVKFTNDREKIYKGISEADFGYGTSLYDAVDFSLRKYLNKIEGRKAVVLFTDGVDTTSRKSSYDESVLDAEESGAIIYPIYFDTFYETQKRIRRGMISPIGTSRAEYAVGKRYLEDLAAYTGGRVFYPESTQASLTEAFEGIALELRRQYFLGYYPKEVGEPGERKKIKVRVNLPNLTIRARESYIVGANN